MSFVDHVEFDGALNGESFGRFPNGEGDLYPVSTLTPGALNSGPRVGPILISEVMYAPLDPQITNVSANDMQFVELFNTSNQAQLLDDWSVNGLSFSFPAGVTIGPEEVIVLVPFDPDVDIAQRDAFHSVYRIGGSVELVGPFAGQIDNSGETLTLIQGQYDLDEQQIKTSIEDQIDYEVDAPWATDPVFGMHSLNPIEIDSFGNDAGSWVAEAPTPGSVNLETFVPGDFNEDDVLDELDIDLLIAEIIAGTNNSQYDLTVDDTVDQSDLDALVYDLIGTTYGDAYFDRKVDLEDLAKLATNFGQSGKGWAEGNFTTDDVVDLADLAKLATNFGQNLNPLEGSAAADINGALLGGLSDADVLTESGEAIVTGNETPGTDSEDTMSWSQIDSILINDQESN